MQWKEFENKINATQRKSLLINMITYNAFLASDGNNQNIHIAQSI